MPVKKSFLNDTSKFYKAIYSNSPQQFEKDLKKLMNQANENYDKIYRKSKNNPDIEKFNTCRENFSQIKSIIELKASSTPLINKLYLEAWISTLYSDVHALNLQVETKTQLKELIGKIQAIEVDFEKLSAESKKFPFNLDIEGTVDLLQYIQNFENTWKINKIKLLADIYFNFGLTLEENSNLENALIYFTRSKNSYKEAAKIAADSAISMNFKKGTLENELSKGKLEKAVDQTQKKIQSLLNKKNPEASLKELCIHLQRIPDSASKWTIVNESSPAESIKEKQEIKFNDKNNFSSKIKRKFNKESIYPEPKKQKIDFRTLDCKKILYKFNDININLSELTNTKKSFDERKAIVHNNYAIYLIECLNNQGKNFTHYKKLEFLQKAAQLLKNSAKFYKKADLVKEKGYIIECIATINSCQKNLKTQNQPLTHQKDSSIETQGFRTKSLTHSDKMRQYQTTFSTRLAYRFFNTNLPENNLQTTKPIIKNISP